MPMYLVERTYAMDGERDTQQSAPHRETEPGFLENNSQAGVTWIQSFVTHDNRKSFCLYKSPTPEAVRHASYLNGEPVDRISQIDVLMPVHD